MRKRKGIYLPIAAVIITLLLVLAASRITLSRRHLSTVARLADGEKAYQLAASACQIGVSLMQQTAVYLNEADEENIPKDLRPLVQALREDGKTVLKEAVIPLEPSSLSYLESMASPDDLDLVLILGPVVPLYTKSSSSTLTIDPREATVTISIVGKATVGQSTRKVRSFTKARLINVTPPVVGKFALFIKSFGPRALNSLADGADSNLVEELPLSVLAGQTEVPADTGSKSTFIGKQGWCFLGGPDDWRFNLSLAGGRPDGEEGVLCRSLETEPLPAGSALAARGDFAFYACETPLHSDLGREPSRFVFANLPANEYEKTSLLNIWGTVTETTPTLVVGKAYRRFAQIRGLLNETTGIRAPFPNIDETVFSSSRWPGGASAGTISVLRQTFDDDFSKYEERMSRIVEEPYNGVFERLGDGGVEPIEKLEVDGFPATPNGLVSGQSYTLLNDKKERLFHGASFDDLSDLSFLTQKASLVYNSSADLFKAHRKDDGSCFFGGGLMVRGSLQINEALTIFQGGGGVILASDNISIESNIECPSGEPLTLISLGGDIYVRNCAQVDAALIALEGTIEMQSATEVRGLLAARKLSLPNKTLDKRCVAYNPSFDPTDSDNYENNWRLTVQKEWQTLVH